MVLIHVCFFCLNDTAPTEIYTYDHTLSLHDALPICSRTPAPPLPPKKTIASAVIAPFLVKPNDRASTPARQLTSAGAQPRKAKALAKRAPRSEEHTSELQSLMRTSYAVFCLKKNNTTQQHQYNTYTHAYIQPT